MFSLLENDHPFNPSPIQDYPIISAVYCYIYYFDLSLVYDGKMIIVNPTSMGQPAMFFRDTSSRHAVGEHVKKYEQPRRWPEYDQSSKIEKRTTARNHEQQLNSIPFQASRGAHDQSHTVVNHQNQQNEILTCRNIWHTKRHFHHAQQGRSLAKVSEQQCTSRIMPPKLTHWSKIDFWFLISMILVSFSISWDKQCTVCLKG